MQLTLTTKVDGHYREVMERFDRQLFEALKPPMASMSILAFTGSKKGDRVHIRFESPIQAEWISEITEDEINDKEAFFVDEGVQLPFPLKYWRHKHIVRKIDETSSYIIDDIQYEGPNTLVSFLLYPAMYIGFAPRKKVYQQYFKTLFA
ncbi:MAG: hypothetical protein AAF985_16860 [Bacteroidota bacterium]